MEDLGENRSTKPEPNVSEVHHSLPGRRAEVSLGQVLRGQIVKIVFFSSQELEELEVCVWPCADDGLRCCSEKVLASLGTISAQAQASICRCPSCNFPKTIPGDALHEIGSEVLVAQARGTDGLVCCSPSNVREAPVANIARVQVLEMSMYTLMAFVLTASITCASHNIKCVEAHSSKLLFEDPGNICSFLAWAVHDVPEACGADDRRNLRMLPFAERNKGAEVENSDLKSKSSEARLVGRALVGSDSHPSKSSGFSLIEQGLRGTPIHSSIEEQHLFSQARIVHEQISEQMAVIAC